MDLVALSNLFQEHGEASNRDNPTTRVVTNKFPNDENVIWTEHELESVQRADHLDPRERPFYDLQYAHHVGTEDMFLGLQGKSHSTHDADICVVTIELPKEADANLIDLDVTCTQIDLRSPNYRLSLPLPQRIHEEQGTAKWDKQKHSLRLDLKLKKLYES